MGTRISEIVRTQRHTINPGLLVEDFTDGVTEQVSIHTVWNIRFFQKRECVVTALFGGNVFEQVFVCYKFCFVFANSAA